MEGRRTALIVLVPEVEEVLSPFRFELDPVARLGVPAHVSVLFPFVPAISIDEDLLARVAAVFRPISVFEYSFSRSDWFGDEVLWLAPDESERFRDLTRRVWTAFPAHPPYEGMFDDIVPHLTVADRGPIDPMREAAVAIQSYLPIRAVARAVTLLVEQASGQWIAGASFALTDPVG